jgi:hypothetical protein
MESGKPDIHHSLVWRLYNRGRVHELLVPHIEAIIPQLPRSTPLIIHSLPKWYSQRYFFPNNIYSLSQLGCLNRPALLSSPDWTPCVERLGLMERLIQHRSLETWPWRPCVHGPNLQNASRNNDQSPQTHRLGEPCMDLNVPHHVRLYQTRAVSKLFITW